MAFKIKKTEPGNEAKMIAAQTFNSILSNDKARLIKVWLCYVKRDENEF